MKKNLKNRFKTEFKNQFFIKLLLTTILMSVIVQTGFAQAQVPSAPTNLVATGINNGGLIQFTTPSSNGGSAITNYQYS
jgi:hypothetical protein